MSSQWVRGGRCGVDNCRSRYYRTSDGLRICQFGHVNESHIEINDEEDDAGSYVVTKRIKLPKSSQYQSSQVQGGSESIRLFGKRGKRVVLRAFQIVLKTQAKNLIEHHGAPRALETTVKRFWMLFLQAGGLSKLSKARRDADGDGDTDTDGAETNSESSILDKVLDKMPMAHHLVGICYLACRYHRLPVYTNDFIMWIMANSFPYLKTYHLLPTEMRKVLPQALAFEPSPPINGNLYPPIMEMYSILNLEDTVPFNYEPLLFRVVYDVLLPPQIYTAAKRYIESTNTTFDFSTAAKEVCARTNFPEVKLISLICLVTRLFYLYTMEAGTNFNWEKWISLLQSRKFSPSRRLDFHNTIMTFHTSKDMDVELIGWDDAKCDSYLDWFTTAIVEPQLPPEDELPIASRRLFDILPIDATDRGTNTNIDTTTHSYQQLIGVEEYKSDISLEDMDRVQEVLSDVLICSFGIKPSQISIGVSAIAKQMLISGNMITTNKSNASATKVVKGRKQQ